MFLDPLRFEAAGGEMIFHLPNGLQGYFLADGKGRRVLEAPTSIVTDKFAEDKTVRNGLACMRCHDRGMKTFLDVVRSAVERLPGSPGFSCRDVLALYAPQDEMDRLLQEDAARFETSLARAIGKPQVREPLIPVSQRFLEAPLALSRAAAELGLPNSSGLEAVFRSPRFAGLGLVPLASGGVVRRDTWEDYFDDVVTQLGLGIPVVPIDGLSRTDLEPGTPGLDVTIVTNRRNNVFSPGDELVVTIRNRSTFDIHVELIGASADGRRLMLVPASTTLKAGGEHRFPSTGSLTIQGGIGKEQIILYASRGTFPAGELLRARGIGDRVIHDFYRFDKDGGRIAVADIPRSVARRTLTIETR